MADNDAAIIRKLHSEIRGLNRKYNVLKKTILEQYPEGEITKDDLQALVILVKDLGLKAKAFDELSEIKKQG